MTPTTVQNQTRLPCISHSTIQIKSENTVSFIYDDSSWSWKPEHRLLSEFWFYDVNSCWKIESESKVEQRFEPNKAKDPKPV